MGDLKVLHDKIISGMPPVARPQKMDEDKEVWFEYSHYPYGKKSNSQQLQDLIVPETYTVYADTDIKHQIPVQLVPDDANCDVTFTSNNPGLIQVDNDGNLTYDGSGTWGSYEYNGESYPAIVTVSAGNISKQCYISIAVFA